MSDSDHENYSDSEYQNSGTRTSAFPMRITVPVDDQGDRSGRGTTSSMSRIVESINDLHRILSQSYNANVEERQSLSHAGTEAPSVRRPQAVRLSEPYIRLGGEYTSSEHSHSDGDNDSGIEDSARGGLSVSGLSGSDSEEETHRNRRRAREDSDSEDLSDVAGDDTDSNTGSFADDDMAREISTHYNSLSRLALHQFQRSETRRPGLSRVNAIKRRKPNTESAEADNAVKAFFEEFRDAIEGAAKQVKEVLETDPMLSCLKNHHNHRKANYAKEMDNILSKSQSHSLFVSKKRKLAEGSNKKRQKLSGRAEFKTEHDRVDTGSQQDVENEHKQQVLNVTYNSYLRKGSSFDVKSLRAVFNFFALEVDYFTKKVTFLITIKPVGDADDDYRGILLDFLLFSSFEDELKGFDRLSDLEDIFLGSEDNAIYKKPNLELFNFVASGTLVDFNETDFRTPGMRPRDGISKWMQLPPYAKVLLFSISQYFRSAQVSNNSKLKAQYLHAALDVLYESKAYDDLPLFEGFSVYEMIDKLEDLKARFGWESISLADNKLFETFAVCKECLFLSQSRCIPLKLEIPPSVVNQLMSYIESHFTVSSEVSSIIKDYSKPRNVSPATWIAVVDRSNGEMALTTSGIHSKVLYPLEGDTGQFHTGGGHQTSSFI